MKRTVTFAALCLTTLLGPAAHATNVMDMEAEMLIRAAGHTRDSLALTPNQHTLWQQVTSKSEAILRARKTRRERLQAELKTRLPDPNQDLRELGTSIDRETAASAEEERQLRQLWLTLCDALTDPQRAAAVQFMVSQLERVDRPERGFQGERPGQGERRTPPGGKGRGPGGAGF